MIKRSVGIYIDKTHLQLAILSGSAGKVRLVAADSLPVPQDAGIVSAAGPAAFEADVRELLKRHNIKESEAVTTALPPELIVIRYFQMTRLAAAEHKTAVPIEARKYLPYKLQDTVYTYTASYEKVASNKMAVTFVAAEKPSVSGYVKFFENIKLRPAYLEAVPYSLLRLLYYTKGAEPGRTVVLIYIGRNSANINLIRNNVIYLSRNVLFAGRPQQGPEDASRLDNLSVEIRLSFDYFHRQFPEEKIEKIIIWSDDKAALEWAQRLGSSLNTEAKVLNPFDSIGSATGCPVEYATGCGLALRGLIEPYKDINLSPVFTKIENERLTRLAVFEVCLAIALIFMFYIKGSGRAGILQKQLADITAGRPAVRLETRDLSKPGLARVRAGILEKTGILQGLVNRRISVVSKLDRLSLLSVEGMWFDEISFVKPKGKASPVMIFKGFIYRPKGEDQIRLVNQFMEGLKTDAEFSRGFTAVKLDSVAGGLYDELAVTSFQILCSTG